MYIQVIRSNEFYKLTRFKFSLLTDGLLSFHIKLHGNLKKKLPIFSSLSHDNSKPFSLLVMHFPDCMVSFRFGFGFTFVLILEQANSAG